MAIPGFNDPHGDMHGHFEKWVYEQLCIPVLGPITGWHIILIVVVAIGSLVYKYVTKPGKSVTARHILVKTETECLDLKAKIESNQMTFAEAAEGYSTCPSGKRGGQLGTFGPGMMVPAFDAVCFKPSTPLKTTIGPVQTHFGFHLIYMEDRTLDTKSDKTD